MDFQSFVNETFRKLAVQGQRSMRPQSGGVDRCLYNGPNGLHCAIGFWLAGVSEKNNGDSAFAVRHLMPLWMQAFPINDLTDMQQVHDTTAHWTSPEALWSAMSEYGHYRGVTLDPSIRSLIWANWKGVPPGDLPEVNTLTIKTKKQADVQQFATEHLYTQYAPVSTSGPSIYNKDKLYS